MTDYKPTPGSREFGRGYNDRRTPSGVTSGRSANFHEAVNRAGSGGNNVPKRNINPIPGTPYYESDFGQSPAMDAKIKAAARNRR